MNGFLPTRASLMLDFVALAMLGVCLVMLVSIVQVKFKRRLKIHRTIQMVTAAVLTVALIAFEVDVRFFTNWRELAEASPFYESGWVERSLWVHLLFAIPTPFVWAYVIYQACTKFDERFQNEAYRQRHRTTGWLATILMLMTSLTGWVFYYLAFVAS